MPELPEVEILARHLGSLLKNKVIHDVEVRRARVLRPTAEADFKRALKGARFVGLTRRGKYLWFTLRAAGQRQRLNLLGHLGMTGRMYLQPSAAPRPRHTAVRLSVGKTNFIFEDVRYFGRLTLDTSAIQTLGPEPLGEDFTPRYFAGALKRSRQPIKVKLLDQSLVAGVGNIYASEALFRAGISPRLAARRLAQSQIERLWRAIRDVLAEAIRFGSTVPLDWTGTEGSDGLFYYGSDERSQPSYDERLEVYDRAGRPCYRCNTPIRRIVQAARSTFFCPSCQRSQRPGNRAKSSVDGRDGDL